MSEPKQMTVSEIISFCILTVILFLCAGIASAQTCDLRFTASLGGCDNVYTNWFTTRNDVALQTLRYSDGFSPALAASARSYSRSPVGCGAHFGLSLLQQYANGQTCTATLADNHNRGCDQCAGAVNVLGVVNALSFGPNATADSIAAGFGVGISTVTMTATARPLPFNLGGVQVWVDDVPAEIFYVSPDQVNFHIPANLSVGLKGVRATNAAGQVFKGEIYLANQAPGIPTVNSNGEGAAAADYGKGYLALFVTGVNPLGLALSDVTLRTNNTTYQAQYIGKTGDALIGITQINFLNIPINGQGAQLTVAGFTSNGVTLSLPKK